MSIFKIAEEIIHKLSYHNAIYLSPSSGRWHTQYSAESFFFPRGILNQSTNPIQISHSTPLFALTAALNRPTAAGPPIGRFSVPKPRSAPVRLRWVACALSRLPPRRQTGESCESAVRSRRRPPLLLLPSRLQPSGRPARHRLAVAGFTDTPWRLQTSEPRQTSAGELYSFFLAATISLAVASSTVSSRVSGQGARHPQGGST